VHCALSLAVAFAGLAALYLHLGAPFVGWAQVLVYIGAVAILIVFAILLTRSSESTPQPVISRSWVAGIAVAVLVFGVLTAAILSSTVPLRGPSSKPEPKVRGSDRTFADGGSGRRGHHRHARARTKKFRCAGGRNGPIRG
jgi:NADH-quinone oxidoreductase subunit J